jgi:AAA15 family ATPase/GTPase
MAQILDGVCVGGFRSFVEPQYIGPLTKVNVFAGINNVGKSNLLRFVSKHLPALKRNPSHGSGFESIDKPLGGACEFVFGLAASRENRAITKLRDDGKQHGHVIDRFFQCAALGEATPNCGLLWFTFSGNGQNVDLKSTLDPQVVIEQTQLDGETWRTLWNVVRPNMSGGSIRGWVADILHQGISPLTGPDIETAFIPPIRQVLPESAAEHDYSGRGLIKSLADLQHPEHDKQELKDRFRTIERFLKSVTENESAAIEIPTSQKYVMVNIDGKSLPLDSLGMGLHEVIILAAVATVRQNHVICLEEPEIHLHPIYQRKLIKYLNDETNNQYLIATHSAHLLDAPEATVFHVSMENDRTRVRRIVSAKHRWDAARELGARASDVVQSNSVIWVEGPSDRIYLNHWIRAVDPSLIEGVHYSMLFYGGKVLSHFTAQHDPEVDDLVSMLAANRHSVIVMDRDRDNDMKEVNETKQRVLAEIAPAGGIGWVTAGREIENYLPPSLVSAAVRAVNPEAKPLKSIAGRHSKVLPKDLNKVKVALEIVKSPADLSRHDLRERVAELVNFVRKANHLSALPVDDAE